MKNPVVIWAAGVVGIVAIESGCRSPAVIEGSNDVNAAIDEAVAAGAEVRPSERPMIVRMLSLNEKDLITGLRTFAELSGGRYPASLDTQSTLKQVETDRLGSTLTNASESEKKQMLLDIFFATAFYDKLQRENRKVEYHGDTVTRDDAGKVLLCWSEPKDRYRIVLGDLSTRTLSAEQLTQFARSP